MNEAGNEAGSVTVGLPKKFADHSITAWGYTYFVRRGDLIKIGHSGAPKGRLSSLGKPLDILAVVPNTIISEPAAHQKFAHLRETGEWFRVAPDLLSFIEQVKAEADAMPKREPRAPKDPALSETIGRLDTLRRQHGPNSEVGFACSNLIGILNALPGAILNPNAPPNSTQCQRTNLLKALPLAQARLARTISALH